MKECKECVEQIGCNVNTSMTFLSVKTSGQAAKASLDLVCTILIGQLPTQVKCKVKAFYADVKTDGSISDRNARKLI